MRRAVLGRFAGFRVDELGRQLVGSLGVQAGRDAVFESFHRFVRYPGKKVHGPPGALLVDAIVTFCKARHLNAGMAWILLDGLAGHLAAEHEFGSRQHQVLAVPMDDCPGQRRVS